MANDLWRSVEEAFFMFWETLWALVLGFALSGAVQEFVSRDEMRLALGDHRPRTLARSSLLGVVSSSCSYASSALAKTLFARGADFTASMVFMLASTNLVVELGAVLWLLIGWQFALAELVGGIVMIVLLGVGLPRVVPGGLIAQARLRLEGLTSYDAPAESRPWRARVRSRKGWEGAAGYTVSDVTMVRKELAIGFAVAGFLAALVPDAFWASLFLSGHGFWSSLASAVLGPLLAIASFVCSVGNVPLAAALWHGGIGFGGVVSFVFADLITLPLLLIYRQYFGARLTLVILASFWVTMSGAGLAVEYLFTAVGIPDPPRPSSIVHTGFEWNYTTWLDMVAIGVFATLFLLHRRRDAADHARYAQDPVCGMQVDKATAPARSHTASQDEWFCSDRCKERYQRKQEAQR
jgi:hypothetical protein